MTVRELIQEYPDHTFSLMTPGGYVDLTPEMSQKLLQGEPVNPHLGWPGTHYEVPAEEILTQEVCSMGHSRTKPNYISALTEIPNFTAVIEPVHSAAGQKGGMMMG